MFIKNVTLLGFKSFADQTSLELGPGITAVVGPNGSGKSNVAEAVRWVLGEQNPRLMRAGRMEDFIFGGSAARRPVGLAEVRVTMDNEAGSIPLPFREVTLARRLDRAGRSEYLLNRTPCRLRQVEELLLAAGLARDAFFIAQGKVDAVLSARPEDRRRLLEESAGLAGHLRRRAEALRLVEQAELRALPLAERARALRAELEPLRAEAARAALARRLQDELERLEGRLAAAEWRRGRDQLASVAAARERVAARATELEGLVTAAREAIRARQRELEEIERSLDRAGEELLEVTRQSATRDQGDAADGEEARLRARKEDLARALARLVSRIEATRARLEVLRDAELVREAVAGGPRSILEGMAAGAPELGGIVGMVADLVRVPRGLELALEEALGPSAQYFVAQTQEAARRAVEWLKKGGRGRATFLPLDGLHYSLPGREEAALTSDPACVGWAWQLVEYDDRVSPAVAYLLGRVLVARDLAGALRLARRSGFRWRVVTLEGDLVHAGGAVTGGALERRPRASLLGRACLLAELGAELRNLEAEMERTRGDLSEVERRLQAMEEARRRSLADMAARAAEARRVEGSLRERVAELRARRQECLEAWRNAEAGLEELLRERGEVAGSLARLEREQGRLEASLRSLGIELERRHGLGADAAVREPDPGPDGLRRAEELRRALADLGAVQPGAEAAAAALERVLAAAEAEAADVGEAVSILRWLAGRVAEVADRALRRAFSAWQEAFRRVCSELLEGGEGELVLQEAEGVVIGVEVAVRPPERRWQPLNLLSGGERALVAIGLLFALLQVRPSPVCILDEVDAALDDANLERLAAYLRRMADRTQFIVVTHQKVTMEAADRLIGVTLGEDGTSHVVSVRLEERAARPGAA